MEGLVVGDVVPEDVLDLRQADDDGGGGGEAADDGVAEEDGHEAQAQHAHEDVARAHEEAGLQGEQGVDAVVVGGGLGRDACVLEDHGQPRVEEQADQGHGPHGELPAASKHLTWQHKEKGAWLSSACPQQDFLGMLWGQTSSCPKSPFQGGIASVIQSNPT